VGSLVQVILNGRAECTQVSEDMLRIANYCLCSLLLHEDLCSPAFPSLWLSFIV